MVEYDDPEMFMQCVSSIALKAHPAGFLADCLAEGRIDVIVESTRLKGTQKFGPWLLVAELTEIGWAASIRTACIQSDHLQDSRLILELTGVERLDLHIEGKGFDEREVEIFQNAIVNLMNLKHLRLFVAEEALDQAKDDFVWRSVNFSVEILVDPRGNRKSSPYKKRKIASKSKDFD